MAVRTMAASGRPFTVNETHGILLRPEHRIIKASDRLGWQSLYASMQREAPYAAAYAGVPDHLIILHLDGPVTVSRVLSKSWASRVIPPGGLFMLPGGVDFGVRLGGDLSTLHLYVRQAIVEEVAADLLSGDRGSIELVPRLGARDPLIEHAVGLSATHFARRFKRSTGSAPHQYLMRSRVERARRLLVETDNAIAQIAFACGFTHQEHLTRVFHRLSGDTPARFRRGARA